MSLDKSQSPILISRQVGIKTLAILIFVALASFVFVVEPQAAALSVTQHGAGWFSADGTRNTIAARYQTYAEAMNALLAARVVHCELAN